MLQMTAHPEHSFKTTKFHLLQELLVKSHSKRSRTKTSLLLIVTSGLLTGCNVTSKLNERLDSSYQEVYEIQQGFERANSTPPKPQKLTWKAAVKALEEGNISYRQARTRLSNLEKDRKAFYWRQLNPRLFAIANLSSALAELSSLGDDSYGLRLLGSVSVPEPIGLYAQRYSLELQYYQAALDLESLKRRLHANLYAVYLTQEKLDSDWANFGAEQAPRTLEELLSADTGNSDSAVSIFESQRKSLSIRLNTLLDTPGAEWTPVPRTRPDQSYRDRLSQIEVQNGFGRLALKQAAGQLETNLANLWQIKFDRLPSFSTGVALPTFYDSTYDTDPNLGDVQLFGSMNKSFDLTGRDARTARAAEERVKLLRRQLSQRLARENDNLQRTKENYRDLIAKEEKIQRQLKRLQANPPPSQPKLIFEHFANLKRLRAQLDNTQNAQAQLDLQFWVWDEKYWGSPF